MECFYQRLLHTLKKSAVLSVQNNEMLSESYNKVVWSYVSTPFFWWKMKVDSKAINFCSISHLFIQRDQRFYDKKKCIEFKMMEGYTSYVTASSNHLFMMDIKDKYWFKSHQLREKIRS